MMCVCLCVNVLLDTICEMLICYTNTLLYVHRLQASVKNLKLWHRLFDEALAIAVENCEKALKLDKAMIVAMKTYSISRHLH